MLASVVILRGDFLENFANTNIYIFDKKTECYIQNYGKVAVFVNLYYLDSLDYYCQFLNNIPVNIPIYVYSSQERVLIETKKKLDRSNCYFEQKNNRGRDISALLVSAKNKILQYDYFCFIHDKKANASYLEEDTKFWVENLWENTLKNQNYINQVLELFISNPTLGLVVPPEPYGDFHQHWYGDTWFENFELTKRLANLLELNVEISKDKPIFTLGTVFWARTKALMKLFDYPWQYDDFIAEPLPIDGTISHAIERILPYVAQDSGYNTGTVMTSDYASKLLIKVQNDMRLLFKHMNHKENVFNLFQVRKLEYWKEILEKYVDSYDDIYIYGSGKFGTAIANILIANKYHFSGFVVTKKNKNFNEIFQVPIYELDEIKEINSVGIIIGVSYETREEIHQILESKGIFHYLDGI